MLMEILVENDFASSSVTSAAEMDQQLVQDNIDLIVLDVMLPDEDGQEDRSRQLRRLGESLPAIVERIGRNFGLTTGTARGATIAPFRSSQK
jgi:DNA-binding response OmpR family regulator